MLVSLSVGKVADTPLLCILNPLLGPNGPKHIQFYLSSADGTEKLTLYPLNRGHSHTADKIAGPNGVHSRQVPLQHGLSIMWQSLTPPPPARRQPAPSHRPPRTPPTLPCLSPPPRGCVAPGTSLPSPPHRPIVYPRATAGALPK